MITTALHRRQAEDLQALLDGRPASSPAAAAGLAPLVSLAGALAPAEHRPSEDFRVALRAGLVAEAAVRVPTAGVPARGERPSAPSRLRQAVAAAAVASVVVGVGAAAASTRALPGDTLYGLKRQVEGVQLSLAHGDLDHGRELLEQAGARLSEAERLTAGEHGADPATHERVAGALADMDAAATEGSQSLLREYRETGDDEALVLLDRFVTPQRERLQDLITLMAPSLREQARALADRLARLDSTVEALLGAASSRVALTASGDGWAESRVLDARSAGVPFGPTTATGGQVGDVLDAGTGGTADTSGGSGVGGGGTVGGVVGGVTGGSTSAGSAVPTPLPSGSVSLPTSSPLVTDPIGAVTSAVPVPSPTLVPLPTASVCVPVPPLTTC